MNRDGEIVRLENAVGVLEEYLVVCLQRRDWHGVSDAANDLRELEASLKTLKNFGGKDAV